jgi:hypothetical protein
MTEQIQTFHSSFLSFFRPQKREYCLLTWNRAANAWIKADLEEVDSPLTLHRSTAQRDGAGYINVRNRRAIRIDFTNQGFFLKTMNTQTQIVTYIPVMTLTPQMYQMIPASMKQTSYLVNQPIQGYEEHQLLWDVAPPVLVPTLVPPQANQGHQNHQTQTVRVEAIPRRIAWLIAAEAEKEEQSCPITMDTISPLTAAVTTCFHCFDAESLASWSATQGGGTTECPLCKSKCLFTKAYDETA